MEKIWNRDPELEKFVSGINIPDPQRCKSYTTSISPGVSCLACRDRWTGAFSSSPLLSPATTARTSTATATTIVS
jgi:hypothetical protein